MLMKIDRYWVDLGKMSSNKNLMDYNFILETYCNIYLRLRGFGVDFFTVRKFHKSEKEAYLAHVQYST